MVLPTSGIFVYQSYLNIVVRASRRTLQIWEPLYENDLGSQPIK